MKMDRVMSVTAIVVSVVAIVLSYTRLDQSPFDPLIPDGSSPRAFFDWCIENIELNPGYIYAEMAYPVLNEDEFRRTLEVADILEGDGMAVVLYRYSIGSDVFRDTMWLGRVSGEWRKTHTLSGTYGDPRNEWHGVAREKASAWEDGSASVPFE